MKLKHLLGLTFIGAAILSSCSLFNFDGEGESSNSKSEISHVSSSSSSSSSKSESSSSSKESSSSVEYALTTYSNLAYGSGERNIYDLYVPTTAPKENASLVLMIHGGSWTSGSKNDFTLEQVEIITKNGYIAATMNYSLFSSLNSAHEEINFFTMRSEVVSCLSAIKDKAEDLGYTLTGCSMFGFSAGAHLAALTGYSLRASLPIPLKFLTLLVAPIDFHKSSWVGSTEFDFDDNDNLLQKLSLFSGKTVTDPNGAEADEISPAYYIDSSSVPTLYGFAGKDTVVGTGQKAVLQAALEGAGVAHDYVDFPEQNHTTVLNDKTNAARFFAKFRNFCSDYFA